MGRPQLIPNVDTLIKWRDVEGLTQTQITDRINELNKQQDGPSYRPISRSTVSVALHRAGEQQVTRTRYADEIPWSPIKREHANDFRQVMLRCWARTNRGLKLNRQMQAEYDSFVVRMKDAGAVITYTPERGFFAVKARPGIDTDLIRLTDKQVDERGLRPALDAYLASLQ